MGRDGLAGAAHLELVSGVVRLRPEDAMFEAMLSGWRAQQAARGLREDSAAARERLMRRFAEFTGEYPWNWQPGHADPSLLTSGRSPAPTVVGDLLLALRAAGATGISPPRCAACDREVTSMQRHGRDWYCCVRPAAGAANVRILRPATPGRQP